MQDILERMTLTRRGVLVSVAASGSVLATGVRQVGAGTKIAQSAVYYQMSPKDGQQCGQCAQFLAPHGCKLVDGDIAASGWCRLWVKRVA
jgi:hypothetical protein